MAKPFHIFLLLGITAIAFFSCKKDNGDCHGNLCFTLDGKRMSVNAVVEGLPNNHYRLFWEETDSLSSTSIKIDIYGNSKAKYTFTQNAGTGGDAGFLYFLKDTLSSTLYESVSGTLRLTSVKDGKWTGKFSGKATSPYGTHSFDDGKFVDVPLEK